jgi:hypothetical protein
MAPIQSLAQLGLDIPFCRTVINRVSFSPNFISKTLHPKPLGIVIHPKILLGDGNYPMAPKWTDMLQRPQKWRQTKVSTGVEGASVTAVDKGPQYSSALNPETGVCLFISCNLSHIKYSQGSKSVVICDDRMFKKVQCTAF